MRDPKRFSVSCAYTAWQTAQAEAGKLATEWQINGWLCKACHPDGVSRFLEITDLLRDK